MRLKPFYRNSSVIFLLFAISVFPSLVSAGEHPVPSKPLRKLHVAAIFPLTGAAAEHGTAARNGLLLGLEEAQKKDNIKLLIEDDGLNPKNTLTVFRRLLSSNHIDVLITVGSGPSNAVAPLANRLKIPVLALAGDSVVAVNRPYVIRTRMSAQDEGRQIAETLVSGQYQRVALVCAQNSFTENVCEGLSSDSRLPLVLRENVLPDDLDFRSMLQKFRAKKPDAVVVLLMPGQIGVFANQAQSIRLSYKLFGGVFFESSSDLTLSKGALVDAVYVMPDPTEQFVTTYEERFPPTASIAWAGGFYDLAQIVSRIDFSRPVLEQLKEVDEFEGVLGNYEYRTSPEGDSYYYYPYILKKITATGYQRLESVSPSETYTLAEENTGFVCFGQNLAKISSEHTNRLYLRIDESDKLFFNDPNLRGKTIVRGLDLKSEHRVKVFFDDTLAHSFNFNFSELGSTGVEIWRSAGAWRTKPVKGGQCE